LRGGGFAREQHELCGNGHWDEARRVRIGKAKLELRNTKCAKTSSSLSSDFVQAFGLCAYTFIPIDN
jgi:hypothetical protein